MPNALIEAISYKKISLSSNCPTGPREILLNGKAGYLYKNNNYKELARTLLKAINNKKESQKKLDKSKNIDDIKSFCEREINKKLKKYFKFKSKYN